MFIRAVDESLERLVRARLPLPENIGDVSFDPPTGTWAAQLSRLTVNLFLYQLDRSKLPGRAAQHRVGANGRDERRNAQPMIELTYLVSAWAGSPRDEHQLLGDVVSLLGGLQSIPTEFAAEALDTTVLLNFGSDEVTRPRDVWQAISGQLKPCAILKATVPADTWDWTDEAPAVQRIVVLSSPKPRVP